ncbi:hypothetical protein C8R46DRAFT_1049567 [Mycena filopes]|nr:hypothetical protein C8R46DRAFT_1049567 [Mycena filopes]
MFKRRDPGKFARHPSYPILRLGEGWLVSGGTTPPSNNWLLPRVHAGIPFDSGRALFGCCRTTLVPSRYRWAAPALDEANGIDDRSNRRDSVRSRDEPYKREVYFSLLFQVDSATRVYLFNLKSVVPARTLFDSGTSLNVRKSFFVFFNWPNQACHIPTRWTAPVLNRSPTIGGGEPDTTLVGEGLFVALEVEEDRYRSYQLNGSLRADFVPVSKHWGVFIGLTGGNPARRLSSPEKPGRGHQQPFRKT